MTSPIDNQPLAPSGNPTKLPALGSPELTPEFMARVKEVLEVLLGRRGGSQWDRAVTFRDLHALNLAPGVFGSPPDAQDGQRPTGITGAAYQQLVSRLEADLRNTPGYRALLARIGSTEDLAMFPEEIRSQLASALENVARERQADIRVMERKIQSTAMSLASRMMEVTAAVDGSVAGVRKFDAAYAEKTRALATSITQVVARLDDVGGVALEERFLAVADAIDGLLGQWTLKIQTNPTNGEPPVIAGISLSVEDPIAGPGTSSLIFLAEKFGFFTNNGAFMPFGIVGDQVFVNGQLRVNASGTTLNEITNSMINFVGDFAAAPNPSSYRPNDVYKNTTDGDTYILRESGGVKSWQLFLKSGGDGGDGQDGQDGVRGNVSIIVDTAGTTWDSAAATAALASLGYGAPLMFDQVTLRNTAAKYAETRSYSGSAWLMIAAYFNGNLLVDGTVLARHIDTRGLTIRDEQGNIILDAGGLRAGYAAPGTQNSELTGAINTAAGTAVWNNVTGTGKPENDATKGATIGVNLGGQLTKANMSTYIASAAIDVAFIDKATIPDLTALSAKIGTFISGDPAGARTQIDDTGMACWSTANARRAKFGRLI
jgi:hypothetical protein